MITVDQLSAAPEAFDTSDATVTFAATSARSPVVHDISTRDTIIAMTVAGAGATAVVAGVAALFAFRRHLHANKRRRR